jgi:thymidylate synthase (FAD)
MEIINQKVELLKQEPGIEGIYKQIELAGRTAYKSENRITEDSAKKFVDMLINREHNAALEHGIVYLKADIDTDYGQLLLNDFIGNPYTFYTIESGIIYLTTNYRVIIENNLEKYLKSLCNPTTRHKRSYTFRITTSRAIANEIVRHRVFSFMQESTRYCNYSAKKFNNELTYVIPSKFNLNTGYVEHHYNYGNEEYYMDNIKVNKFDNDYNFTPEYIWIDTLYHSSDAYLLMLKRGCKPEIARGVLSLDLKTELIVTGMEWDNFFKLRCAKDAHPDIQIIANEIKNIIKNEENPKEKI